MYVCMCVYACVRPCTVHVCVLYVCAYNTHTSGVHVAKVSIYSFNDCIQSSCRNFHLISITQRTCSTHELGCIVNQVCMLATAARCSSVSTVVSYVHRWCKCVC